MTIQQDTHNGSGTADGSNPAESLARTVEAAEAALRQASAGVAGENKAAIKGMLAGSRAWMSWAQDAGQANLKAWQALLACRSAPSAIAIHGALWREQLQLLTDNGRRMTLATWKTAFEPRHESR